MQDSMNNNLYDGYEDENVLNDFNDLEADDFDDDDFEEEEDFDSEEEDFDSEEEEEDFDAEEDFEEEEEDFEEEEEDFDSEEEEDFEDEDSFDNEDSDDYDTEQEDTISSSEYSNSSASIQPEQSEADSSLTVDISSVDLDDEFGDIEDDEDDSEFDDEQTMEVNSLLNFDPTSEPDIDIEEEIGEEDTAIDMDGVGIDTDDSETEDSDFVESETADTEPDSAELDSTDSDDTEEDTSIEDNSFIDEFGNVVVQEVGTENFKLEYIPVGDIVAPSKRVRKDAGVSGLVSSIRATGLLVPIIVAPLATAGKYILIKGKRRLIACMKTGMKEVPCIVNTKIKTTEIAVLEALYNHYTAYNMREIVDYIEFLEKEKHIVRGDTIEYLLQLNSGDYAKLKDILTDNDEDIVPKLMDGEYDIERAFKALEKRRKSETKEQQMAQKAEKVFENTDKSGLADSDNSGEEAGDANLTDEEIKNLNIDLSNMDEGLDDKSLDEMVEEGKQMEGFEAHQQDTKHREHMDPAIRKAILVRDNYTCQCCDIGGQAYIGQLDTHHVVPVFLGGKDEVENGTTLCVLCHSLVHAWSTGELQVPKSKTEEELEKMSTEEKVMYEHEQKRFKRVIKLGNFIRQGMKAKGIKKEAMRKMVHDVNPGRNKPGQGQKADL